MYIKLTNGEPENYTIGQLRRDNPSTSFPKKIPAEILETYDVYPLKLSPIPAYNELTEFVLLSDLKQVDGGWVQNWEITELPISQQIENLRLARADAYTQEADPLFFKTQRGEATMEEWQDKVQEIKGRYSYPENN